MYHVCIVTGVVALVDGLMSLTQMCQNPVIDENYHPFTHTSIFIRKLHRTEGDKTYACEKGSVVPRSNCRVPCSIPREC